MTVCPDGTTPLTNPRSCTQDAQCPNSQAPTGFYCPQQTGACCQRVAQPRESIIIYTACVVIFNLLYDIYIYIYLFILDIFCVK